MWTLFRSAAFRRNIFDRVGMYNEKLVRNQDNDLNARIRKSRGQDLSHPRTDDFLPSRQELPGLPKYAYQTSQWHFFTLRENRESLGLRHLAPAVFLIVLLLLLPASFLSALARSLLIGTMCAYFLAGFYFSMRPGNKRNFAVAFVQPFASFCFHVAYGAGTILGLIYLFRTPSAKPIRPGLAVKEEAK